MVKIEYLDFFQLANAKEFITSKLSNIAPQLY